MVRHAHICTAALTHLPACPPDIPPQEHELLDASAGNPYPRGTLREQYWSSLHEEGQDAPFKVRGPSYYIDSVKVAAGPPEYTLESVGGCQGPVMTACLSCQHIWYRVVQIWYTVVQV